MRSDYNEKFGIPRQAGLVCELRQEIVIAPEFRNPDALRGLEGFSHVWLIWGFSETAFDMEKDPPEWYPTVRPPRLGGGVRKGVWVTRSPYRPNSLGLSCVKLESVETSGELKLIVSGADMMDGTPVYDIKPYIPYSDCKPEASGGFTDSVEEKLLRVEFPEELLSLIDEGKREGLIRILGMDPRGAYEKRPGYSYGLSFGNWDVKFTVEDDVLTVTGIERR